jgi:hypothetical protein
MRVGFLNLYVKLFIYLNLFIKIFITKILGKMKIVGVYP